MNKKSDSFEHSELISAYLDGEVTEEERALVENDPVLLSEVEKLQKIIDVTSSLLPIDPELREKHLREAVSQFSKDNAVIPFRQRKSIQGGLLIAAAAAAIAFVVIPATDSQDDNSNSGEILATGFVEDAKTSSEATELDTDQTSDPEANTRSDANADSQAAEEAPQATTDDQTDGAPPSETPSAEVPVAENEEGSIPLQDEGAAENAENGSEQMATADMSQASESEQTFRMFQEATNLEPFLEQVASIWEIYSDSFASAPVIDTINLLEDSHPEFSLCWNRDSLFNNGDSAPLHLEITMIGGEPTLVVIFGPVEEGLDAMISVYQITSTCSLLFEGSVFEGMSSD